MGIGGKDHFIRNLCNVLGLPDGTKAFALHASVDEQVTVDCTYFPNIKDPETVLTERFHLVRVEDQETTK